MNITKGQHPVVRFDVNPKSHQTVLFAEAELKKYLTKITGVSFQRTLSADRPGLATITLKLDHKPATDNPDAFKIVCTDSALTISGASSRAVLYGVYALLERLGCRWVYPMATEEIVPTTPNLRIRPFTLKSKPAFLWRSLFFNRITPEKNKLNLAMIDWMAKNRVNMIQLNPGHYQDNYGLDYMNWADTETTLLPELKKRSIMINMNIHHVFHFLPPDRYFKSHPDWYALQFGIRAPTQLCYSNKDALKTYAENIIRYLKQHPEVAVFGLWPMDGISFCHCVRCRPADTIFKGCMWVAEYLQKHGITIPVEYLIYTSHSPIWPTADMQAPSNVVFQVCRKGEFYKMWSRFAQRNKCAGIYNFDYGFADNYAWMGTAPHSPGPVEQAIREITVPCSLGSSPLLMDTDSWWRGCFALSFYFRMLWNGAQAVEPLLNDYCKTHYGVFAGEIKKALRLLDGIYPTRDPNYKVTLNQMQSVMKKTHAILARVIRRCPQPMKPKIRRYQTYASFAEHYMTLKIAQRETEKALNNHKPKEALQWIRTARRADRAARKLSRNSKQTQDGVVDICYFPQWFDGPPEPGQYNRQTVYNQWEYRATAELAQSKRRAK